MPPPTVGEATGLSNSAPVIADVQASMPAPPGLVRSASLPAQLVYLPSYLPGVVSSGGVSPQQHVPAPQGTQGTQSVEGSGATATPQVSIFVAPRPVPPLPQGSAAAQNRILDIFDQTRSRSPGADAPMDDRTRQDVETLQEWVVSGEPPQGPMGALIQAALGNATANTPEERTDVLLKYMATPSWTEWALSWGGALGRVYVRELTLSLVFKFMQSNLAFGLTKFFMKVPQVGNVLGLMALILPVLRQLWALYSERNEATIRAQISRILQVGMTLVVIFIATTTGGYAMLGATAASTLSYLVGNAASILGRAIWPMSTGQSDRIDGRNLAGLSTGHAVGIAATQIAQKKAAPDAGANAFSKDPVTGKISGHYHVWQQVVEAVIEVLVKELFKSTLSTTLQQRTDNQHRRDEHGKLRSRRVVPHVQLHRPACPKLKDYLAAFVAANQSGRQTTAIAKAELSANLSELADQRGWSALIGKGVVPVIVAVFEATMYLLAVLTQEKRQGEGGGGLNCDMVTHNPNRRDAVVATYRAGAQRV